MKTIETLNQLKNPLQCIKRSAFIFTLLLTLFYSKSINAQDAGVYKISSPVSACNNLSSAEKVSIIVVNHGFTNLDTIPVAYRIDSGTVVHDTIIGSLGAGDSLSFTFATTADLSATGLYNIKAYTALPNDINHANDTTVALVQSMRLTVGFSANGSCQGRAISFVNSSKIDSGSLFYAWNFGDGSGTSVSSNPVYTYKNPGTYIVSLLVNSTLGCTDSISHTIKISTSPVAAFIAHATCIGSSTTSSD